MTDWIAHRRGTNYRIMFGEEYLGQNDFVMSGGDIVAADDRIVDLGGEPGQFVFMLNGRPAGAVERIKVAFPTAIMSGHWVFLDAVDFAVIKMRAT